jgi:uncharacterized protein (TIGR02246 family)
VVRWPTEAGERPAIQRYSLNDGRTEPGGGIAMERIGMTLTAALVTVFLLYGAAARSDDTRESIESSNRAFAAAFLRGDAEAVAELYTEDAELLPPGAGAVAGRAAIAAFWKGAIDAGVKDLVLATTEVESTGDLAWEVGTVRIVANDGRVTEDRYLVVWKRENGNWKLHRDIWNSPN